MALQSIPGGFFLPSQNVTQGLPTVNFYSGGFLTGTGTQRVAWVIQVPKTGTLDKFELMCNFVSSPSDVKFSFQDVDASGLPDGTPDQYRVKGSITAVWQAPGLMTSDGTDGGVKRSVTAGQMLACVTEWNVAMTGEVDWAGLANNSNSEQSFFPYLLSHNGTSWTKRQVGYPGLVLKYDDGTYEIPVGIVYPIQAINTSSFASNSTPDERALYFSFPVPVTVAGGWFHLDLNADVDIVLYDTDGTTALATCSIDGDHIPQQSPAPRYFRFATPVNLTAAGNYRLSAKPTTTTSISTYEMTFNAAAILAALPGGSGFQLSTRTDAGSWTQTTTTRPLAGLLVTKIDDAVSAGGMTFAAYAG